MNFKTFQLILVGIFLTNSMVVSQTTFKCSYSDATENEQCIDERLNSYTSFNAEAEQIIDRIVQQIGIEKNFIIYRCDGIENCLAFTSDGGRYIVYDLNFLKKINLNTNTNWAAVSVLAHEIGHHLQGHTLKPSNLLAERRNQELQADKFSGFILSKLGASLSESKAALNSIAEPITPNSTHPSKNERLFALETGFKDSEKQLSEVRGLAEKEYAEREPVRLLNTAHSKYFATSSDAIGAIQDLTAAINLKPKFADAYSLRAFIHAKESMYEQAIKDYKILLKINPENEEFFNNIAVSYTFLKDFKNATENFEKCLKTNPNNINALHGLGYCYGVQHQFDKAFYYYTKVIDLYEASSKDEHKSLVGTTLGNRGEIFRRKKDFEAAIKDLTESIILRPSNPDACYELGRTYFDMEEYHSAISWIEKAKSMNKSDNRCYNLLAECYLNINKIAMSNIEIEQSMKIDPTSAWTNLIMAKIMEREDLIDALIYQCSKIIYELNVNDYNAWRMRGFAYMYDEQFEKAAYDFTVALSLMIHDSTADISTYTKISEARGLSLLKINKIEDSQKEFESACYVTNEEACDMLKLMNQLILKNRSYSSVLQEVEIFTLRRAAASEWSDGNVKRAIRIISKLIEIAPSDYLYNQRGYFHLNDINPTLAILDFSKSIEISRDNQSVSVSYYYRGLSNVQINEMDSACSDFEKAAQMGNTKAILEQKKHCKK